MNPFDLALAILSFGALCFFAGYFVGGTKAAEEITKGIGSHVRR